MADAADRPRTGAGGSVDGITQITVRSGTARDGDGGLRQSWAKARAALPAAALVILALLLAAWSSTPPAAVGAGAPVVDFSAARAMATVRVVGREPHPAGSPAAAASRLALAQRMRAIGLTVTTLHGVGASVSSRPGDRSARAGRVETLLGVLPGTDPGLPAVAIMAHTDSVEGSYGAADDGAGVAVALETARALAGGRRPVRSLLLILTDGEEAGLLGAYGFFADPARVAQVGAVINVDSRGSSGLGMMFETGPRSGGLVALYRARAQHRSAQSAATFLYRLLPNRTDLTAAMDRDVPALNFAFLDGEFDYHTPRDRIADIDPRTLQSLGDQVLPVVRALAETRVLPPRGADGVFGDADGIVHLGYPAWLGWPLLAIACGLSVFAARGASLGGAARAALGIIGIGLAAALAVRLGYALTGVGTDWAEHHRIMARFGRYEAGLTLAGLAVLMAGAAWLDGALPRRAVALGCLVAAGLATGLGAPVLPAMVLALGTGLVVVLAPRRAVTGYDRAAGTLVVGLFFSAALQAAAPALTPLLLWPTLVAAAGSAAARSLPPGRWLRVAFGLLPLAYAFAFGHAVLLALGIPAPEAVGLFAGVAALLVLPLVGRGAAWPAMGVAVVAAILLLSFRWTGYSDRYPALSQVYGVVDEHGRSWRVSPLERPDVWTSAALAHDGGVKGRALMPIVAKGLLWRAPARAIPVPAPQISLAREGALTAVTVQPAAGGREMRLRLNVDRALAAFTVEDQPLRGFAASRGTWQLHWHSPGESVTLRFRTVPGTKLTIEAGEVSEPAIQVPDRPDDVVPWLGSDRTVVVSRASWRL